MSTLHKSCNLSRGAFLKCHIVSQLARDLNDTEAEEGSLSFKCVVHCNCNNRIKEVRRWTKFTIREYVDLVRGTSSGIDEYYLKIETGNLPLDTHNKQDKGVLYCLQSPVYTSERGILSYHARVRRRACINRVESRLVAR